MFTWLLNCEGKGDLESGDVRSVDALWPWRYCKVRDLAISPRTRCDHFSLSTPSKVQRLAWCAYYPILLRCSRNPFKGWKSASDAFASREYLALGGHGLLCAYFCSRSDIESAVRNCSACKWRGDTLVVYEGNYHDQAHKPTSIHSERRVTSTSKYRTANLQVAKHPDASRSRVQVRCQRMSRCLRQTPRKPPPMMRSPTLGLHTRDHLTASEFDFSAFGSVSFAAGSLC